MSSKPLIPTPPAQKWRYMRVHFLPSLVFFGAVITVGLIWQNYVLPVSLIGRVETVQADVSSPRAGLVSHLRVKRFDDVKRGDVITQIVTTEEAVLKASLAVIRAEVEVIQAGQTPLDNTQRNAINYEQLRAEWMQQRVDLAMARINHQLAEVELQRTGKLFFEKIVSQADYDTAKSREESLAAEVMERSKLVEITGQSVAHLKEVQDTLNTPQRQIDAAITQQEARLKLTEAQMSPLTLMAPIGGRISFVHRWSGEAVAIGDPIVTISATNQPDSIIGFLRQPLYVEPKTNMAVQVRTRGIKRLEGVGRIVAIGAQLSPLNDIYVPPMKNVNAELGLPIQVSMPMAFKAQTGANVLLHPGELVDLTLLPSVH